MQRARPLSRTLFALSIALLALYPVLVVALELTGIASGARLYDYGTYYYAAQRFLAGGPLYGASIPSVPYALSAEFMYPPVTLLVFLPFAVLPFVLSGILWTLVSLAVLLAGANRLVDALGVSLSMHDRVLVSWCVLGFAPTVVAVKAGQASVLVAGLLCFALASAERDPDTEGAHGVVSAVLSALVVAIKPYYAPVGAPLLRSARRFAAAVLTGVALLLLSVLCFGVETNLAYVDLVARRATAFDAPPVSEWHAAIYSPWYALGPLKYLVKALLIVGTTGVALRSRAYAGRDADRAVFLLGLLLVALAAPWINVNSLTALIPVFIVVFVDELTRQDGRIVVPAVALILVQVHPYTVEFIAKFGPNHLPAVATLQPLLPVLQPAAWGTLLLFGLVVYRTGTDFEIYPGADRGRVTGDE